MVVRKGGSMAIRNGKNVTCSRSNLVRCLFKDELDKYCEITKRDRTIALFLAWQHYKETDFYKRDMLGLKVK
jgi:hypothetical protein